MGVEVKGAGDGVVIADRGCNDGCGYRDHSGWALFSWNVAARDIKNGQQEIKCLIENTAKDQEIARLNRVVDAQRPEHYQSSCGCLKRYNYTGSVIFNLLG